MDLAALLASVIVSVGTVGAGYLVARRFQKLGGGEAQERLNAIRKELDDAMSDKLSVLDEAFQACKTRLAEVEDQLKRMRSERIGLKQDIDDMHEEIRTLQASGKVRGIAQDGRDKAQDARTTRQNVRDEHQDARDK